MLDNRYIKQAGTPLEEAWHKATHAPFGTYGLFGSAGGLARALLSDKIQELEGAEKTKAIIRSVLLGGLAGLGADTALAGVHTFKNKGSYKDYTDATPGVAK